MELTHPYDYNSSISMNGMYDSQGMPAIDPVTGYYNVKPEPQDNFDVSNVRIKDELSDQYSAPPGPVTITGATAPKKPRGRRKVVKEEQTGEENVEYTTDGLKIKQEKITDSMVVKKKRKFDRFKGMSEEEVLKRVLPDHLKAGLDIVIIGINPGLTAAFVGHHYAGPGNHFWKCLFLSGIINEQLNAYDDRKLLDYGIGFTNIVERTSRGSADLTKKEIKEGGEILLKKLQKYQPKIAVFNGKGIYEVFCGNKSFPFGKQPDTIPGTDTHVFVMPSSSARCCQLPRAIDKVPFYNALRKFRDHLNGKIKDIEDSEIVFQDVHLVNAPRKVKEEPIENAEARLALKKEPDPDALAKPKRKRRTKKEMEAARAAAAAARSEAEVGTDIVAPPPSLAPAREVTRIVQDPMELEKQSAESTSLDALFDGPMDLVKQEDTSVLAQYGMDTLPFPNAANRYPTYNSASTNGTNGSSQPHPAYTTSPYMPFTGYNNSFVYSHSGVTAVHASVERLTTDSNRNSPSYQAMQSIPIPAHVNGNHSGSNSPIYHTLESAHSAKDSPKHYASLQPISLSSGSTDSSSFTNLEPHPNSAFTWAQGHGERYKAPSEQQTTFDLSTSSSQSPQQKQPAS